MSEQGLHVERDPRYQFQGYSNDLLIGLGRLLLGSSSLESSAAILLARLIDNSDDNQLAIGRRIAANSSMPWLLDHIKVLSEYLLPTAEHALVMEWIGMARSAYAKRSRIVHAGVGVDVTGDAIQHIFFREDARKKEWAEEIWPVDADEVHEIAQELERVSVEAAMRVMQLIPRRTADR